MNIQELINNQMDHFVGKMISQNQISIEKVMDVATHTAAYLIRNRHIQNGSISDQEMEVVLQSIAEYLTINFKDQFLPEDFKNIQSSTLDLLKTPTFDQDIQDYFKKFYT